MKRFSTAIIAFGIALVFLLYMVTFTVDYNKIAIVKTFGAATPPDPAELEAGKDTGSVIQEPGLKFKWPWPVQRVQTYPTQLQVLTDTAEQLQLSDSNTIVVNLSLTWRIKDPLSFSNTLETIENAESKLVGYMRDKRSVISGYNFDDLVNEDATQVRLDEIENKIAKQMSEQINAIQPSYGIEVAEVTIGKMLYAESTAGSVNERMTASQQRLAQSIRSQGTSQAEAIVSEANSISNQLKYFADTVATQIEIIGINESNAYLARYAEPGANEDLAIYLRQLEAIEKVLANRTTFVLDAKTFSPLDVLVYGHGGEGNLSRLLDTPSTEPTAAAPLTIEQQNKILSFKVEEMEARVVDLLAQIERLEEEKLVPVKTENRP